MYQHQLNGKQVLDVGSITVDMTDKVLALTRILARVGKWKIIRQWSIYCGSSGVLAKKPWYADFAGFGVVNTLTMASFKLPVWGHWTQSWGRDLYNLLSGLYELAPAGHCLGEYLERNFHPISGLFSDWFGGRDLEINYFLKFRRNQMLRGIRKHLLYIYIILDALQKIFLLCYINRRVS